MLGKTVGRRRRGWQRMRWLEGITDSMDEFEQVPGIGDGQGGRHAAVHGVAKSQTWLSNWTELNWGWGYHGFINHCLTERHFVVVVQSLSRVWLFMIPRTIARQASLSIIIYWSLLKFRSIESVMPSNHLILCRPLLLPPSIFPNIRVFSNESALLIRWPQYWSLSFSISPSNEYSGLISFRIDWFDLLQSKGLTRVFSNTTVQKHQFFSIQPLYCPTLTS